MLYRRSTTAFRGLVGFLTIGIAINCAAQEPGAGDDTSAKPIEEVVVTGTRIKRRDFHSPSPLTTVDREDLAFSGQPTLEEYLNQMPQMQPDFGRTANNPGDGTARLNLRGLGAGRTLVLLNGRRIAPSGIGSAVDVNNLPRALIDRVEIITGGASTVYGSDAIAGVVNFILRDDFDGLSMDGSYNVTGDGDAEVKDFNVTYGHQLASGRGNVTLFASYYDREALFASERELTRIVWRDTWEGELVPWGSPTIPGGRVPFPRVDLGTGTGLVQITWDPDGTPRAWNNAERYNFAPINYLQVPLERLSAGLMATIDVADHFEAYFEAAHTNNEATQTLAEAPYFDVVSVNTDNPLLTAETRQLLEEQISLGPGIAEFGLSRRMRELGPRIIDSDREYARLVAGIRGNLGEIWEMDAWLSWSDATQTDRLFNDGSRARALQGLLVDPATGQCVDPSNGCVPLDLFGEGRLSPQGAEFIRVPPLQNRANRNQKLVGVVLTGAPFDIWSGPLNMAFGMEWREDEGDFTADDALFTGDTMSFSAISPVLGSERVYELYTEVLMPLIDDHETGRYLGLELGARWSDYKNAGSVWTWKAGLEWQATDSLRLRAMQQHAVRAPNIEELFAEQFIQEDVLLFGSLADPCSASQDPVGSGVADKCTIQGLPQSQLGVFEATSDYFVEFTRGGNRNLVPEESDTTTIGLVVSPSGIPDLTIAVDYFELEVTDTIGEISAWDICFDPANTGNVFCSNISRDATGNASDIFEPISNRGVLGVEGFDTQVQYSLDLPTALSLFDEGASLDINTIWTHTMSATSQENIVAEVRECLNLFGWPCANNVAGNSFPDNRWTSNFNYTSGPLDIHVTWRWIDSMDNATPLGSAQFGFPDPDLVVPNVSSHNYFDLGFGYRLNEQFSARLGINNLLDKDPPNLTSILENNTDARLYDVFGRSFYLSFNWDTGL